MKCAGGGYPLGRRRASRCARCRTLSGPIRQFGAITASGPSAKSRAASCGCGTVRRRERALPPLHSKRSRSSTRGTPAAARPSPEIALELFEAIQHLDRVEIALNKRRGVREVASSRPVRGIENDRRRVEQTELVIEACDGRLDDALRSPVETMRSVRTYADGVEVRCISHCRSPRSWQCRSPAPRTCRRSQGRKRRATVHYARAWPVSAKSSE